MAKRTFEELIKRAFTPSRQRVKRWIINLLPNPIVTKISSFQSYSKRKSDKGFQTHLLYPDNRPTNLQTSNVNITGFQFSFQYAEKLQQIWFTQHGHVQAFTMSLLSKRDLFTSKSVTCWPFKHMRNSQVYGCCLSKFMVVEFSYTTQSR